MTNLLLALPLIAACGGPAVPDGPDEPVDTETEESPSVDSDTPVIDTPTPQDSVPDTETEPPPDVPTVPATFTTVKTFTCPIAVNRNAVGHFQPRYVEGDWADHYWSPDVDSLFEGGGAMVADLDGNGLKDIMLPGERRSQLFLQTSTRVFVDRTNLLPGNVGHTTGAAGADVDDDGDIDFVVTRYEAQFRFLRNYGNGVFADETEEANLIDAMADRRTTSTSWADLDHDGDLDMFIGAFGWYDMEPAEHGDPSLLFRNRGDGTWDDISSMLPQQLQIGYTFVGSWIDFDNDGWLDLYAVNDFGNRWPSVLMWNRQGTLTMDDGSAGLHIRVLGMGIGVGDLNADRVPDLFVAGWGNNALMVSDGTPFWFEEHRLRGLTPELARNQEIGWSPQLVDIDHDQDLDAVEAFGYINRFGSPRQQPDQVWYQDELGNFIPAADTSFAMTGQTRGIVAVDLDDDGFLDMVRRDIVGPASIHFAHCDNSASMVIDLDQPAPNIDAIGAQVFVTTDITQQRSMTAGGIGLLSGQQAEVHFGLAQHATADIEVVWPDGMHSFLDDVPTRQKIVITR